jgi:cytoskeleton protein RodZ
MVGTRSKRGGNRQVGERLVTARRRQRFSLEFAAQKLNIPVRQLQAMEAGDFSIFAAEVYARGAYLRYAEFLGLDPSVVEPEMLQALSATRERVPLRLHTPLSWFERVFTPRWILLAIVAVIACGISGYIIWQVGSFLWLPFLKIEEPARPIVATENITVKGQAEPQAQVTINGETVLLQNNGYFQFQLYLHPGVNVLHIEAKNTAGRKQVFERHLLLPRQTLQ